MKNLIEAIKQAEATWKKTLTVGTETQVRNLQDDEYELVQVDHEVKSILDSIGYEGEDKDRIDHLLITGIEDGEYGEIWAIDGIPDLSKYATLIYLNGKLLEV